MFLKKIIFFEQYRGYNLLYSEAGAVGAWHDIQGNGGRYMELQLVNEWVKSAEGCFAAGDIASMRACGRQMLEESPGNPVAMALIAEASVYMQDFQEAESWLEKMDQAVDKGSSQGWKLDNGNLRILFAKALYYGAQYELSLAMEAYEKLFAQYEQTVRRGLSGSFRFTTNNQNWQGEARQMVARAYSFYADTCLLAGETEKAAKGAFAVSNMVQDEMTAASYFSKGLFISNYREAGSQALAQKHRQYGAMFPKQVGFPHDVRIRRSAHAIRVGYISPDFRLHAAAYFFSALLKAGNHTDFTVYGYSTGREDHITQRFKKMADYWRNVHGRSPQEIAKLIHDDRIDILVDLSGHSQNNCLPVMACRPAPVQISGIGYINTTGLPMVDYFLTDEICMPSVYDKGGFSETPLRLPHCHLCYQPETMREIKSVGHNAPAMERGYVTFGSFNSFAKVTDEMLVQWRNILQAVPNSKLVIKCKICSVPSGQEIVRQRFKRLGGNPDVLELRPFSPDYLTQYGDIDIVLDTAPYNGGLTTCDALYMGVPVIALRGKSHGSRYGASILTAAGVPELIAENLREYTGKAVQLAKNGMLLNRLHRELPELVRNSRLMDGKGYMQELEKSYRQIWGLYCQQG